MSLTRRHCQILAARPPQPPISCCNKRAGSVPLGPYQCTLQHNTAVKSLVTRALLPSHQCCIRYKCQHGNEGTCRIAAHYSMICWSPGAGFEMDKSSTQTPLSLEQTILESSILFILSLKQRNLPAGFCSGPRTQGVPATRQSQRSASRHDTHHAAAHQQPGAGASPPRALIPVDPRPLEDFAGIPRLEVCLSIALEH